MISLEAYRARIGTFNARSSNYTKANPLDSSHGFDFVPSDLRNIIKAGNIRTIALTLFFLNLHLAALKFDLLLVHGIESNPGPTFSKAIEGSFHQGDPKFGDTAGFQCTGNSLIAICFGTIKRLSLWKSWNLDYILHQGDALFKLLQATGPLEVEQMPRNILIESQLVEIELLGMQNSLFLQKRIFSKDIKLLHRTR